MTKFKAAAVICLATMALPAAAFAHPGHELTGFAAGVAHPFLGADHLLAMLAVGIWASLQPMRSAWQGPALFMAMLAAGSGLGVAGVGLPFVEPGILASIVLLGLMILTAQRLPVSVSLALIGGFALLHGHAHGTEAVTPVAGYMMGFLAASGVLHAAGYLFGSLLGRTRFGVSLAGFAIAAAGAALIAG